MKEHYDICVTGFWYAYNYGSILNGYSTYSLFKEMGKEVLMLQKPNAPESDSEITTGFNTHFVKKYYDSEDISPVLAYDSLDKLNDICDCFCAGSDQIWNYNLSFREKMYLPFAKKDKRLISFSTSFGHKIDKTPDSAKPRVRSYLERYSAISVREQFDVDILKHNYGINATLLFEPVFCIDKKYYLDLAANSEFDGTQPYMLAYILDPTPQKREAIKYYCKKTGLKAFIFLDGNINARAKNKGLMDLPDMLENPGVEDFLKAFMNASFVITDSFHGSAFSIIFNKPFLSIGNPGRGLERFNDLLGRLGMIDRFVGDPNNIPHDEKYLAPIDYTDVNRIISEEKEHAVQWLRNAINTPVEKLPSIILPKTVVQKLDMSRCIGCGACAEVCPTSVIDMLPNERGFYNPVINKDKCIYCGKCTSKCIALNPQHKNTLQPQCYAIMANDNVRKISSSGGMFTLAAEYVLTLGGYVCGAAFTSGFEVEHIVIDNLEELDRLRGSKYIQSQAGRIYPKIKELLEHDKYVLFTGMPCQVAGLYSYLGKEYEKLYTIDLLCHGITSQKVFDKYRDEVLEKRKKRLTDIKFKAKEPWGWHAGVNAFFSDGSNYAEPLERDPYYIAYLNSISKNTACGSCPVNQLPRQGDITIGDFWGIEKFDPALNDGKGTSVVLVNNAVGEELLQKSCETAILLKDVPLKIAIDGNHCIEHPYPLNKNNKVFFDNFDILPFDALAIGCKENRLYEQLYIELIKTVPKEDMEYYYLAKAAAENSHGRQIVTWIRSGIFERILEKYFGLNVAFGVSVRKEVLKKDYIADFSSLKGQSGRYYLVSLDRTYDAEVYKTLREMGYSETKDFIFRQHKPVVLENLNLSNGNYYDGYGNTVEGFGVTVGKIVFRGWNNHIVLNKNLPTAVNLSFDMCSNGYVEIGESTRFNAANRIEMIGYNGFSSLRIGKNCRFIDSLFRFFNNNHISSILIGDNCTFETNLDVHVNSGKKLVMGKDCMVSHNIHMYAGDGHSIFDVKTGKNINSLYENLSSTKNQIVIGNHVWVGYGAFIMHGTNIADGSIVGAQSVVKGTFPNNCSIAGNPAKIVRRDCAWSHVMVATDMYRQCGGSQYVSLTSNANAPISGHNVLVVGGTRFMGVQLVQELINRGNNVTIATRGNKKDSFGMRINRIKMDVSDAESVKAALNGRYFDVVFDNLALDSTNVYNLLSNVKCGKYIQLSSIAAYRTRVVDMKESEFDPYKITAEIKRIQPDYTSSEYSLGKRLAEAIVYQRFGNIKTITVRIPYVTRTERLYYYCKNVINQVPMNISDISKGFTLVRDTEVGKFLPWIAAQDYTGPINLASEGLVTIKMILDYIEAKTGQAAIIDIVKGSKSLFNEKTFSLNLDKAKTLGYRTSNINDWFWKLMDEYINRALREKMRC